MAERFSDRRQLEGRLLEVVDDGLGVAEGAEPLDERVGQVGAEQPVVGLGRAEEMEARRRDIRVADGEDAAVGVRAVERVEVQFGQLARPGGHGRA